MKVIKSDRRYKYFHSGYQHIIEFRTTIGDRQQFSKVLESLESMYGPAEQTSWDSGWMNKTLNHHYRVDYSRKLKRRRIYLKKEQDVTFIVLKCQLMPRT